MGTVAAVVGAGCIGERHLALAFVIVLADIELRIDFGIGLQVIAGIADQLEGFDLQALGAIRELLST